MAELHIQKFLRGGKTLRDLYQRYEIQFNINEELGIVVFNYRVLSPKDSPIVQESRALVLELDTWNVVSKSHNAFFEPSERYAQDTLANFDWKTAKAMEKRDGALVALYFYKGEWRCCTRFSPEGALKVWSINSSPTELSWRELTELTLKDMGETWDSFTEQLDKDIFYTFELTAPENRVLVVYDKRELVLIGAVQRDTLEQIDIYSLDFPVHKPIWHPVKSLEDCWTLVKEYSEPYDYEGFVVIDKNLNLLKIRNPRFSAILNHFSVEDEAAALREIRMMDITGMYGSSGSGSSSLGISDGSALHETGTPSLSISDTSNPHGTGSGTLVIEGFSVTSMLNRMLFLAKHVTDAYEEIKTMPISAASTHPVNNIWPEAIAGLKSGLSMSDVLDRSSESEIIEALVKFEATLSNSPLKES